MNRSLRCSIVIMCVCSVLGLSVVVRADAGDKEKSAAKGKAVPGPGALAGLLARLEVALDKAKPETTRTVGGGGGGKFNDRLEESGVLVGLKWSAAATYGGHRIIKSLQPIYVTRDGLVEGKRRGHPAGKVHELKAKPGYAIGGMVAKGGHRLDGFRVVFMRIEIPAAALDPKDSYESDWCGGRGGGGETRVVSEGQLVIGIRGGCGADIDRLGFVLAPKDIPGKHVDLTEQKKIVLKGAKQRAIVRALAKAGKLDRQQEIEKAAADIRGQEPGWHLVYRNAMDMLEAADDLTGTHKLLAVKIAQDIGDALEDPRGLRKLSMPDVAGLTETGRLEEEKQALLATARRHLTQASPRETEQQEPPRDLSEMAKQINEEEPGWYSVYKNVVDMLDGAAELPDKQKELPLKVARRVLTRLAGQEQKPGDDPQDEDRRAIYSFKSFPSVEAWRAASPDKQKEFVDKLKGNLLVGIGYVTELTGNAVVLKGVVKGSRRKSETASSSGYVRRDIAFVIHAVIKEDRLERKVTIKKGMKLRYKGEIRDVQPCKTLLEKSTETDTSTRRVQDGTKVIDKGSYRRRVPNYKTIRDSTHTHVYLYEYEIELLLEDARAAVYQ